MSERTSSPVSERSASKHTAPRADASSAVRSHRPPEASMTSEPGEMNASPGASWSRVTGSVMMAGRRAAPLVKRRSTTGVPATSTVISCSGTRPSPSGRAVSSGVVPAGAASSAVRTVAIRRAGTAAARGCTLIGSAPASSSDRMRIRRSGPSAGSGSALSAAAPCEDSCRFISSVPSLTRGGRSGPPMRRSALWWRTHCLPDTGASTSREAQP